jgi:parvulin-like peptidyl-prolyl isomerase
MRSRSILGLAATGVALVACSGLKDALTAHVDVVARAGSQELSVTRLGDLLGNAKIQVAVTRDNAAILTDMWTSFQQLAFAAAHGDSLKEKKSIDLAIAPILNAQKLQRFMDSVGKTFKIDSGSEAAYNQAAGGLVAARHILVGFKNQGVPPTAAEKDSLKKKADMVRAQVTNENFVAMVKKYSTDPGAAQNNGNYGVFPKGQMIPEFYNATAALKPGEISQPVASQFGFHIIQRLTYAEAKADFVAKYSQTAVHVADSTYMADLATSENLQVKDNAPAMIKDAVKDLSKHRNDKATLATAKNGDLSVSDFIDWLETFPPQQQITQRIPQAPDSVLKPFVKQIAIQQLLLKRADAAKVDVPAADRTNMYNEIGQIVTNVWQALGIDPKMLADSAKSTAEKERVAASRVDSYMDRMMAGQAQPMSPPPPLKKMLEAKYEASINAAGIDRAVERATKIRASADSARAANQPKSQVPIPGAGGPPPGGAPPPAAQPPATAPKAPPKKP